MDGLIDRRSVSLDVALALLAAVRDEASSRGLALAIAVGNDWGWNTTDSRIVVYAGGVPQAAGVS